MDDDDPERRHPLVIGAVLCGGASRRMGRDKATMAAEDGRVLAAVAADALRAAGVHEMVFVGGDAAALRAAGLAPVVPDRWPGAGPLGAIVSAWAALPEADALAVLACDLPRVTGDAVTTVRAGLRDADDAAVARTSDGGRHPLLGVYRRSSAGPLAAAFFAGTRSVHEALGALAVTDVLLATDEWAHNANEPADL